MYIPEWADESPYLSHECDEYTYYCGVFDVAINTVRDDHGGDDLISCCSDGGSDDRRYVPMHLLGVTCLNEEDDRPYDAEEDTRI